MKRIAAFAFVFMALATGSVLAQDYPTRPIRILSPYSPGGISDIAARIVAGKLTEAWGQQVIVENRPGGNGFIAVTDAARAAPDGYTLVMVTAGDVTINPSLFKTVPYDVDRDLAPVSAVSDAPLVLAANGETPYKRLADVIAAAKAQPGMLNIGSPGYGSINHLMLESISLNTGTKFTHVPYKGGAPAVQALVAGDIPLAIIASSTAAPHVASGKIRILGISTGERSPLNPEWPPLDRVDSAQSDAAADYPKIVGQGD
jgi:tripartite-type tricarboxylate transporter receptor subunit TctC